MPGRLIAGNWRFSRSAIIAWLRRRRDRVARRERGLSPGDQPSLQASRNRYGARPNRHEGVTGTAAHSTWPRPKSHAEVLQMRAPETVVRRRPGTSAVAATAKSAQPAREQRESWREAPLQLRLRAFAGRGRLDRSILRESRLTPRRRSACAPPSWPTRHPAARPREGCAESCSTWTARALARSSPRSSSTRRRSGPGARRSSASHSDSRPSGPGGAQGRRPRPAPSHRRARPALQPEQRADGRRRRLGDGRRTRGTSHPRDRLRRVRRRIHSGWSDSASPRTHPRRWEMTRH